MWPHLASAAIGLWLMAAPAILGYGDLARTHDRVVGPVVAAVAIVAMAEVTRALRWINVAAGVWMILAPFVLGFPWIETVHNLAAGVVLAAVASVRGRRKQRYGGGWMALFARPTASP